MAYDLSRIASVAGDLDAVQNECMITLALKIADDSCKMDDYERGVFMQVYDAMQERRSDFYEALVFDLIEEARRHPSAQLYASIKPLRQAGMEHIGRDGMKAFKAHVRQRLKA